MITSPDGNIQEQVHSEYETSELSSCGTFRETNQIIYFNPQAILKYDFGFQFGRAGRIGSSLAVLHIDVRLVIGREKENVRISVETL